jgi:hypothetical protein
VSEKIKTFQQAGLYLLTAAGLTYSAYQLLRISAGGIENLQIEDILFYKYVLFVFVSAPMLIVSAFISLGNRQKAAKIAFWGAIFGWVYIILSACAGFTAILFFVFIVPAGFLQITLPGVLLFITTVYSRRVQHQV